MAIVNDAVPLLDPYVHAVRTLLFMYSIERTIYPVHPSVSRSNGFGLGELCAKSSAVGHATALALTLNS